MPRYTAQAEVILESKKALTPTNVFLQLNGDMYTNLNGNHVEIWLEDDPTKITTTEK